MCVCVCVCTHVWEKTTEVKTVQNEKNCARPKTHFPCNWNHLISPLYGDLLRPHSKECQHFTAWLWKAGRDSRQSIMLPPAPHRPIQGGMLLQGTAVLPSGRYSYITRLKAGSFHCLEEVLLMGEMNADIAVILLQFHFKVTLCRVLSNQEYYNNTSII